MGKLLGGMFAAVVLAFCMSSTAGAAEIPATAQCVSTLKKEFGIYFETVSKARDQNHVRTAEVALYENLETADCVSDAKPLYKATSIKPFTDECVDAAKKTQAYLGADGKRFKAMLAVFNRNVQKPYYLRFFKIITKIDRLKKQGRTKQAAALVHKNKQLAREHQAYVRKFEKRVHPILIRKAYGSTLAMFELVSLRCLGPELEFDPSGDSPAAKVMRRNGGLVSSSFYFLIQQALGPDFFGPVEGGSSKGSDEGQSTQRSVALARLLSAP